MSYFRAASELIAEFTRRNGSNVIYEQSVMAVPRLDTNPFECDYEGPASRDGRDGCRCTKCGRCGRHTGNSHQGHYWRACQNTSELREFHFCCPGACELGMSK